MSKKTLINLVLALAMLLILGVSAASGAPPAEEETTYTVKLGDNLWTLAEKYLGRGVAYWAIASSTNVKYEEDTSFALIKNPDLIHPGWKFLIPSVDEEGNIILPHEAHGHDAACAAYCARAIIHEDFDGDGVWEPWDADEDGKVELCTRELGLDGSTCLTWEAGPDSCPEVDGDGDGVYDRCALPEDGLGFACTLMYGPDTH